MADGGNVIFKFLGEDSQLKSVLGGIGKAATTAVKGVVAGVGAVSVAFAGMVTASVKARGEMEQLEGGINKLFGKDAQDVMDNASKAFKTAGISASEYMDQVTSFSASLVSSLGGDTAKAAKIADRAIQDMADNANTFGTSMESIQNAYQGFAKGNYTMLDNLKLGYAGTKEGIQKLIKDASKMKDIQKELNIQVKDGDLSFANIANAISLVQKKMGIMGTTANEAEKTLTGSIASMKAAWQNFLAGTGDLGQVVDSAGTAFENVMRIVNEAMPSILNSVNEHLPEIINLGLQILQTIGQSISDNLDMLLDTALQVLGGIATFIVENIDKLLDAGLTILETIINGIADNMDKIAPTIVDLIIKITDVLIEHLPELTTAGIKLIVGLATGLIKAIPQLIEKAPEIISSLVDALLKTIPELWNAGNNLMKGFKDGIKGAVPLILKAVGEILIDIGRRFAELPGKAVQWGRDMLNGFSNGIQERIGALRQHVENVANSIRSMLHFSRPDEGPLRDYETWLPDMIEGMTRSLEQAKPMLLNEIGALAEAMNMSPTLNGGSASYNPSVNVVVNNSYEQDPLGQMVNQIKTFSNGAKNDYNYGYGG